MTELPAKINRRELLRTAARLGGLTAAAALMQACRPAAGRLKTETSTASPQGNAAAVPTPTRAAVATATVAVAPRDTVPPPATTASRAAAQTPVPTATRLLSPTPAPDLTATAVAAGLARVAFVKTDDRAEGVRRALALLGLNLAHGEKVALKPNFNSADPAPGSTHEDVLRTLVEELWNMGARAITVADRSGMGDTRRVLEQKQVPALAEELGFEVLALDDLEEQKWAMIDLPEAHWERGYPFARLFLEAHVVQTCCLKTHRFGGHFTLSLKNSVGMVAKFGASDGYNYMQELHSSPHQRRMIAEINAAYTPALVVMDGVEAFVTGGPDTGKRVAPGVMLAGTDRVALDAVGVALLRHFGTTPEVSNGPIFAQEQLTRAVELGLGVEAPDKIELLTDDPVSQDFARTIRAILMQG